MTDTDLTTADTPAESAKPGRRALIGGPAVEAGDGIAIITLGSSRDEVNRCLDVTGLHSSVGHNLEITSTTQAVPMTPRDSNTRMK
ncbi:hypothetical protein [Nocardia cyriacigeorgica]|uniref:hypothetical protein n=1 Tax=Nocardia cyriacigeorgica TaxID=135487 RepID=UPI0010327FD7|nr:hypothetical protein [Nocardia cyriacigeorgica]MBF6318486.1 hypothetical protein [Nocardia cyriacigeorgica]MBF6341966.1 hypothetical protein [Nocardia cyriacigeorgica]MBF6513075.1 hypothetical protein [Nocardia cyriacigeorgica]MBF6531216.1 hypothetical protein [Nocardia cyriacigeorgica]